MDFEKYSQETLAEICSGLNISPERNKERTICKILDSLANKSDGRKSDLMVHRYKKLQTIGKGKEGTVYDVEEEGGEGDAPGLVMKCFRRNKSSKDLILESELQKKATREGVAPVIREVNTLEKYIVMDKLDRSILSHMKANNGRLSEYYQKQIINLFKKLDRCHVFHGDANIANYMLKKNRVYLIDYGMSKPITDSLVRKLGTHTPNLHIMTLGLILKLKEIKSDPFSYSYLKTFLTEEQLNRFRID